MIMVKYVLISLWLNTIRSEKVMVYLNVLVNLDKFVMSHLVDEVCVDQ